MLHVFQASNNAIVATYTYDSWGNILSATGSQAQINPFRYRGYYYDEETGFYWLSSRYYDPEVGRFINADTTIASTGGNVLGYNMYAYCFNNPINMVDSQGNWPRWITAAVAAAATTVAVITASPIAVTVALAATVTYALQSIHYDDRASRNQGVPQSYSEALTIPGADTGVAADFHQFTAENGPNEKVCWPDGKEGIYSYDGDLVTDPRDVGTYNYFVPTGTKGKIMHTLFDVIPWIVFGNDDNDPGPLINYAVKGINNLIHFLD